MQSTLRQGANQLRKASETGLVEKVDMTGFGVGGRVPRYVLDTDA